MAITTGLSRQLDEISALIGACPLDQRAERISGWTVGEQLDHATLVLRLGFDLLDPLPEPLSRGINLTGRTLLALGWLPRGVARSPEPVRPRGASPGELRERIAALRERLRELEADPSPMRDRSPRVPHPYFGGLTPAQGLRFLEVHTRHHLKIVRDIRRAAARPS